jgi:Zn-dependent protease with chaperone function
MGVPGGFPMTVGVAPYPPAPANVPPDLTTPTTSYRVRVLVVLTSLFLFTLLYVGLVAGSAYLCYSSFAALGTPGPKNLAARNVLQDAARTDERLSRVYNDAVQQRQQGKIDDSGLLQVLERDLLPPWRAQRQRLAQLQGLPGAEQQLVDQLSKSFQLQEESWELLGDAIRHNDRRSAELSQQKARQSEQLARQFTTDAERYYRRHAPPGQSNSGFWNVVVGIAAGVLCLFLVKGFFKWRRADPGQRLEITEKDQPVLFAFIRQLCHDTRAPLPHRVYLTPEVNAAVFYHESLLSLFLPTPKNLVIGLGLVNQLNLSEFKAVLAHEFGHFSQNSMKLGRYVYTSNRVIGDLVFGRDWLDDLVAAVRGFDIRIAIFAWAFTGVLWTVRKTLQGLFRAINFANSALSRQMEFNADLVAVSVTGSDALVHGLARLDFAMDALGQAWSDLTAAADHQLYSRDLFYHQTRAGAYLRAQRKDPRLGEPPALPEDPHEVVQVFQAEDTSVPKMWATHPSNHDREVNAKRHYLRSPLDERSPWILFQDAAAVRARVTLGVYQLARQLQEVKLQAPEVVQAFIDDEHAETTYHPRYHGLYDHRYLTPGDLDELVRSAPVECAGADGLAEAHSRLYGDELKVRMEAHRARQEDFRRVAPLAQGAVELTGKDFLFRGVRYGAANARHLCAQVQKELDQDFDWMSRLDRQAFRVHYDMARRVGEQARREMEERYRFHLAVQEIHKQLSAHRQQVQITLSQLAGRPELSQEEFRCAVDVFGQAHEALRQWLKAADGLRVPVLKNLTPGEPLGPFLLSKPLIHRLSGATDCLAGDWINRFMEQLTEVLDKAQRIHFKSLGGILMLQEKLAEQCAASGHCPVRV